MRKLAALLLCLALLLAAPAAEAANTYVINGVSVAYTDFSSTPGECWAYAQKLYGKIWGTSFSSDFGAADNLLHNLPDAELTLTPAHLKTYVSAAALGSVLRVTNAAYLHANDSTGHSQIIVQKDDNGFTVLEGGLSDYPYCREFYYTWSSFVSKGWLGGKYPYIKYIKWPGSHSYSPPPVLHTLRYDPNGGVGAPASETHEHGQRFALSAVTPRRTGFFFLGWAESPTATAAVYQPGDSLSLGADRALYAVWLAAPVPDCVLPAALETLEDEALSGSAFRCVKVQPGVTAIGSRAFADCTSLAAVYLPASVTEIAADAFVNCGAALRIIAPAESAAARFAKEAGVAFLAEKG